MLVIALAGLFLLGCHHRHCDSDRECQEDQICDSSHACVDCDPLVLCVPDLNWGPETCIPDSDGTALLFGDLRYRGYTDLVLVESLAQELEASIHVEPYLGFVQLPEYPLGVLGLEQLKDDFFESGAHVLEDERIPRCYDSAEHDFILLDSTGAEIARFSVELWNQDLSDEILDSWAHILVDST